MDAPYFFVQINTAAPSDDTPDEDDDKVKKNSENRD